MAFKKSTVLKVNTASGAATTTVALGAPAWAQAAILHVMATTAAASTVDAKVVQYNPDGTATATVDTGVAIDQIGASATAVGRYAAWGLPLGAATAGTSFDGFAIPVSAWQRITVTIAGTVTNLKVWVEFLGMTSN